MGVPGFFGWIIKTITELKKLRILEENKLQIIFKEIHISVNKLYIDGNCLIHPVCFYTLAKYQNDQRINNSTFLHNKMYKHILKYIKYLTNYVSPTELYLAIDGVAPLAKINQQRKRRFMSSLDTDITDKIKKKYGKYKPEIWNNTCISPGTSFMEGLHKYLINELAKLKIKVTYSSYHVPSEGEHKILQDIKMNSNDLCNVIYGLDADLIFLALASHKDNIYLLREESQLQSAPKSNNNDDNNMFEPLNFVSIDDLKLAINYKIHLDITNKIPTFFVNNDIPDFANDFIFVCYLLGNDFLPHIPSIDIKINGLKLILNCYAETFIIYKTTLLIHDQDNIHINNTFFIELVKLLATYESAHFTIFLPKYLEKLQLRTPKSNDRCDIELWHFNNVSDREENFLGIEDPKEYKYNYYCRYFGIDGNQEEIINKACHKYLEGIAWTTKYYFNKCPSWDYQYPYNYCPFISDIANFLKKTNFNINTFNFFNQRQEAIPILAQLIMIVPPQRNNLLPLTYRKLITNESLIIDMYPIYVTIDTMNKEQRFKCVPNLPLINTERIINTIKNLELTHEEKLRNAIQQILQI